jgi:hypothetical protein
MKKIEPKKWYWLFEIHREGYVPAIKSFATLKKWAERGLLKATIYGTANGKRYLVRGNNLIKFIAQFEAGDFHK